MRHFPPRRLICLTEETVETLYLLGEQDRIVGVSGYAVRPPEVRQKPRVGAFTSARLDKILALDPDLVLAFSDLQADIVSDLAKAGVAVHLFNQRDLAGIFAMIRTVGALIGEGDKAEALARTFEDRVAAMARETRDAARRPRVYFEEWNDPMISAIGWVSELIEVAGGEDVFQSRRGAAGARERIVTSEAVIAAQPDVILASWCGKKVVPRQIAERAGWATLPAVANKRIVEIKSTLILQPGPAALTDGLDAIRGAIRGAIRAAPR
ncbi:MAG: cobalamin-binding protein [Alphaproteobacteria bacterium RIFCSPHIGHO2_12_FULL_66_14]|jgi:iron complex transport system substrate-binding protein|nr:MAG: cobalamin-binding protein [Alphaproteobacteria bacterium RIFCSPHIGHO2_12_FULL_66_14]